ncbi:cyclopropane-fatty-acyl-phospholipid synthase [Caenibius tardaugens NBRC 16725]|uniref:Cyclopropane-fatty-acyl-phospholipid synthase n=1 Tax=Caenibius tardaugens NBRC 16725 TaxID=1219035 RepID=U2YJK2_9SPHN|nr:class I SAM-dependent methyltransferase [Caenibius tardaugens]AZI34830.1 methyltransferase domain-containing protein [Caenibius tardaugens NBRC 16725]GAD48357.1 cyclopropane-fatty-acyl-phospholipid synthase [Caenibius tardaugens NBRC 16725]
MFDRLLDSALRKAIKKGVLEIVHPDGREVRFGTPAPGYAKVRIRLTDKQVAREIIADQSLGAGEAFMDGRLIIEQGDVMGLATLIGANNPFERRRKGRAGVLKSGRNALNARLREANQLARARSNISHHYDIGNDLYRLMLDPSHMQYSCAYWPRDDMTLDEAQDAKLAHIAAKLDIRPGQKVLDIGCGWGGMAIYLAQNFDCHVTGITLSTEQLALAQERAQAAGVAGRTEFGLIDYRKLAASGVEFDRIVSVGMFEHVGRPQFDVFFEAVSNLLADDGVMLLHTIGRMGQPSKTDKFTDRYIFPGGYIPAMSEMIASSEKFRLIPADLETLRLHYAKTLRVWYDNCQANRDAIVAMYDERFFRMWTFYLSGSTAAFETGGMCNYQVQYIRNRHALPLTRDYIGDEEKALLARSPVAGIPNA